MLVDFLYKTIFLLPVITYIIFLSLGCFSGKLKLYNSVSPVIFRESVLIVTCFRNKIILLLLLLLIKYFCTISFEYFD